MLSRYETGPQGQLVTGPTQGSELWFNDENRSNAAVQSGEQMDIVNPLPEWEGFPSYVRQGPMQPSDRSFEHLPEVVLRALGLR